MATERLFDSQATETPATAGGDRRSYDQRLDAILAAATRVIARAGYARASMRAVAREAGVSLAGIYHYVPNKERMLFLIQFRTFNALLNNLRERLHGVDEPAEQLATMIRAHVSYFAANIAALRVCSHELDTLTGAAFEETRRIRREYYEVARAIVDRVIRTHDPGSTLDRHVATMSLFGTLNWLYRWYDPGRERSPNVVAGQIATQFIFGITRGRYAPTGESLPAAQRDTSATPPSASQPPPP